MEINSGASSDLYSLRQALGIATMRKALMQDSQTVGTLLQGMQETSAKSLELAAVPYKGSNIDVRV